MRGTRFISKVKQSLLCRPYFATEDVKIGRHVSFGANVVFNCRRVRIGDGTIFYDNITIDADVFEIGDYGTIYPSCFFPGPGELRIGHNFWLGTGSIVDCQGGTTIGDNVGVGPQSQLWTHMKYGDVMYGCRFHSAKPLEIEDDVWIVGHCLVSPVRIGTRSLAMLGSLVTRDMLPDHTYAGVPATDITKKIGKQIEKTSIEQRIKYLREHLELFAERHGLDNVRDFARILPGGDGTEPEGQSVTVFDVASRTYRKTGTRLEYELIRFLLPDAKFIPIN